ncbi:MAG: MerR family transcriptional regulator [Acidobacteria bacterium]|nr:MerR family transcriptional regulator [Acidobacteriota bacterium]
MNHRTKRFYKIGEVSDTLGLEAHVLRTWEEVFPELKPRKNRAGHRIFTEKDIQLISRIKQLVQEEGYTLDGARRQLNRPTLVSMKNEPFTTDVTDVKEELESIRKLLERARNLLDSH